MKVDNTYTVMWLNEVRNKLSCINHEAKERLKYNRESDDAITAGECVKSAMDEAIEKIEKVFEIL